MVRTYKKKTNRGNTPLEVFQAAAQEIAQEKISIREAADRFEINFMTLHRYLKKAAAGNNVENISVGYSSHRKVFTSEEETELEKYIEHSAKIYYGLTTTDLRKLAYTFATANNKPDNAVWNKNAMASLDWLKGFLKRHPTLSIRTPEATSLSRATAFNRHNVSLFFNNVAVVFEKNKFEMQDIYNVDETGLTTVQRPSKIIAKKGTKQVGAVTSGERGQLVTMALAVNASGNSIPPMLIFPRKNFKNFMITNAPPGCIGSAHPSGWMTSENFLLFIQHFVQFTRCTKEKPVLLILDNHESHLSIPTLNFCKSNGVVLLSFPPHTSHKLQPLDRTVFGPLKNYFNNSADGWLKSNPGKPMTIYDIPGILKEALPRAATPYNIQQGFAVTGIWPYNKDVFQDDEYLPSEVTNRLTEENGTHADARDQETEDQTAESAVEVRHSTPSPQPSTSTICMTTVSTHLTPQQLKPFPKAAPRKQTGGRRKRKSAILTDTPVKTALEEEARAREDKKKKVGSTKKKLTSEKSSKCSDIKKGKATGKRRIQKLDSEQSEDEEDDNGCLVCLVPYAESTTQPWIQCTSCKRWAHVACGKDDDFYICIHCLSD